MIPDRSLAIIRRLRLVMVGLSALILAALGCNLPGAQTIDTGSTIEAVYATITQQAGQPPVILTPTSPAATSAPPVTPTQFALPPTPTPPESRGNVIGIHRCPGAIVADANTADWPASATFTKLTIDKITYDPKKEWSGPDDLSGSAALCWNDSSLFLLVIVNDDVHFQTQRGEDSYKGDEVELMFDSDLRSDFYDTVWNADDYQYSLNPGDFGTLVPAPYRYRPTAGLPRGIEMAAKPSGAAANYILEAEIVWEELGGHPKDGQNYGLCVALSDADHPDKPAQEDTLASHCAGLIVPNPTTWQSVTFVP